MPNEPQIRWAATPIHQRLRILATARESIASNPTPYVQAIQGNSQKPAADVLASEVVPLLAAIRYLESEAETILRTRTIGLKGRPAWLYGVYSQVLRAPFGTILVIGPSNYLLYLAGVQTVQALAAGNSVIWKPGRGGQPVADLFAATLTQAGLPTGLLRITDESVAAAEQAIESGVDKVFFTGSVPSGKALQRKLAETLTPSVLELSGCDATIVLPSANISRVVQALSFGMRLNGSATCMAPRRVLLVGADSARKAALTSGLQQAIGAIPPTRIPAPVQQQLQSLLEDAQASGATITAPSAEGIFHADGLKPILVADGKPSMRIAQADLFAPVLTLIDVADEHELLAAQQACPFGLTASIFGNQSDCRRLANHLEVGTVFINDLIVPSADPRLPFTGRRLSGFGATQGAEGLLEMTTAKTISTRKGRTTYHYDPTTDNHARVLTHMIRGLYTTGTARISGLWQAARSAGSLRR